MSNLLGEAIFNLRLQSNGFVSEANHASGSLRNMTQTAIGTAIGFTGGMGLVAALQKTTQAIVGGVKEFSEYENKMKEVSTLVDTFKVNMSDLSKDVTYLSSKWGKGRDGLASALYEAISANVDAAKATAFLDTAIKTSIGGVTDAKVAVDGLTSIINAYGMNVEDAESVSDSLFVAVRDGKTKFEELANTIGNVSPMAAQLGVDIDTLGGSIATLTLSGQSTSEAVTGLRGVFTALLKPSKDAQEVAKLLGIEMSASAVQAKGFAGFMDDVRQKTAGSQSALAKLFPDVQGLNAVMQLTSDQGAKNFNRVLDDMTKKAGSTTDAAEKMKTALSFKWDKAVQDTKLAMGDIVTFITPAINKVLDLYNAIGDVDARFRENGFNDNRTLTQKWRSGKDSMSTQEVSSLVAERKAEIEEIEYIISQQIVVTRGDAERLEKAKALRDEAELYLKDRIAEEGANKRMADTAKYMQQEAEKANKAESERVEKERQAKAKLIDAQIREREEKQKTIEIAEKNAQLLNSLEEDRLSIISRIASLTKENNQSEIDNKKEIAQMHRSYSQMAYESQIEQLEAIVSDENVSSDKRKKANQDLYALKKKNAEEIKSFELEMLKYQVEAEKLENENRIRSIEEYGKEVEKTYNENRKAIEESTVSNKKEVLKALDEEHAKRKESLDFMVQNNEKAFDQIEMRGEIAANNIDQDFKNKLQSDVFYKVRADVEVELNDLLNGENNSLFGGLIRQYNELRGALSDDTWSESARKQIESSFKKVSESISNQIMSITKKAISLSVEALTDSGSKKVGEWVSFAGDAISSLGESSGNAVIGAIGQVVGVFGSIFEMADQMDKKNAENQKRLVSMLFVMNQAFDSAIIKANEFLNMLRETDTSNYSYSELTKQKESVLKQTASAASQVTGVNIKPEDIEPYLEVMKLRGFGAASNKSTYDEYLKYIDNRNLTVDERYQYDKLSEQQYNWYKSTQKSIDDSGRDGDFGMTQLAIILRKYQPDITNANEAIANYDQSEGLDYKKSKDKSDFLNDIETMKNTGMISELQYYKDLYEYASGKALHPYNAWQWFGVDEVAQYKKQYEDYLTGNSKEKTSGIIGLASGGIVMSPTTANLVETGRPEAVIPLERMPEIASLFNGSGSSIGHITIENKIDPNIPINQDSARYYSEKIGESIKLALRSRGN